VPTAIRLANALEPFNIFGFEEPVPPESYHALQQVRDAVSVPICVGERLYTRWEFIPVLEKRLADFIMPDVTWTGGITELKKIATLS
jgi:galactonate dehydratase